MIKLYRYFNLKIDKSFKGKRKKKYKKKHIKNQFN